MYKHELGDGEPSPPQVKICEKCSSPLSACGHTELFGYTVDETGAEGCFECDERKKRGESGAAQEVSPPATGTSSDPRTGYLKQEEVSPPSPEPEFIDFCDSPCGHSSRYAYTENGGKNIECLLCNRKAEGDTRELKRERAFEEYAALRSRRND